VSAATVSAASPLTRLTAIADCTSDPHLAALADEVRGQEDRLAYVEAAMHHLAERIGMSLPGLPEQCRIRLHTQAPEEGAE
jgi:hypothetical protein